MGTLSKEIYESDQYSVVYTASAASTLHGAVAQASRNNRKSHTPTMNYTHMLDAWQCTYQQKLLALCLWLR